MSDDTTVRIQIRKFDYENLLIKLEQDSESFQDEVCSSELDNIDKLVILTQHEARGGNWDDLETILRENEVEFNKAWDAGSNYGPGTEYFRLNEAGSLICIERSQIEDDKLIMLNRFKKLIEDDNIEELKRVILEEHHLIAPMEIRSLKEENSIRFIKDK